jgi:hypothetical protein
MSVASQRDPQEMTAQEVVDELEELFSRLTALSPEFERTERAIANH